MDINEYSNYLYQVQIGIVYFARFLFEGRSVSKQFYLIEVGLIIKNIQILYLGISLFNGKFCQTRVIDSNWEIGTHPHKVLLRC